MPDIIVAQSAETLQESASALVEVVKEVADVVKQLPPPVLAVCAFAIAIGIATAIATKGFKATLPGGTTFETK